MSGDDLIDRLGLNLEAIDKTIPERIRKLASQYEKKVLEDTGKQVSFQYISFLQYISAEKHFEGILQEIEKSCFLKEDAFSDEDELDGDTSDFYDILTDPTSMGYLLIMDGKKVGYILGSNDKEELPEERLEDSFYIASWGIISDISKAGVGKHMMALFKDTIWNEGYQNIMFQTKDTKLNRRLFRGLGFKEYSVIEDYYADEKAHDQDLSQNNDAVLMISDNYNADGGKDGQEP